MNQQQLEKLKQLLIKEKQDFEQRLEQNHDYGLEMGMNDSVGELSGYDNHPGDIGSELFERGKDLALQDADQHHIDAVNRALSRMERGSYGICEVCHQEIPYERLEAVPWATTCSQHHSTRQVTGRRPIEEEVIENSITHSFKDDSDYNGFDGEDAWQSVERFGTSNPADDFQDGTSYDELLEDNDEPQGYVDLIEGFAITDITGHNEGMPEIVHNEAYYRKERELNLDEDI
ncbi:TraR/DksA C4-type zinc finger protein [Shimazuella sp. AN120528]|uniref:TraR/DksA C4-type zinc finger protein n=1 Tax=Shimazuella soli TaxID=1892854 RepID=UPI001F0E51B2|nr:TraR/DksA C4-type zinc finger protein [Shimazuella soli]MCH5584733.1 TraR/DksA C4-type zinc finger protein [Shimazuella soli]